MGFFLKKDGSANNQITTAMKIVLISENWDCGMTIIVLIIMDSFAKKG